MAISKLFTPARLGEKVRGLQKQGYSIVFTNGCFDILHVGHVRYLNEAKNQGDILVVGMNSDNSVRRIKGEKRPIIREEQRAEVLASLSCIDYITIFSEIDPLRVIKIIKPNILIKGADWPEDKIIGADFVKKNGGRVIRIPVVPDISTSTIIDAIIERYNNLQTEKC